MAPFSRARALPNGNPRNNLTALYYAQRAAAGLIISEAVHISPEGKGYELSPGIYTQEQINSWHQITSAVHDSGGRIFCQLWHVGRVSHTLLQPDGNPPVAPSMIKAEAEIYLSGKMVSASPPRALKLEEIPRVIEDYRQAAINARDSGFDGIEIHAANGYLIDQFIRDGSNQRTDVYGGPVENRIRFMTEVLQAVLGVWPENRVGIRLSPLSSTNGMNDSDPMLVFSHAIKKINQFGIAYLHMVEGEETLRANTAIIQNIKTLRKLFAGPYMANNGYNYESAQEAITSAHADMVSFGRLFIANPDLPERFLKRSKLNTINMETLIGGGEKGYTDYPVLKDIR